MAPSISKRDGQWDTTRAANRGRTRLWFLIFTLSQAKQHPGQGRATFHGCHWKFCSAALLSYPNISAGKVDCHVGKVQEYVQRDALLYCQGTVGAAPQHFQLVGLWFPPLPTRWTSRHRTEIQKFPLDWCYALAHFPVSGDAHQVRSLLHFLLSSRLPSPVQSCPVLSYQVLPCFYLSPPKLV
jgi:hypothetical protein